MIHQLIIHFAVFFAATLQSATGIGFALIAGPVLLIALDDSAAIHLNIILNVLIAFFLVPFLRRSIDLRMLSRLAIGTCFGLPIGFAIFSNANIELLKILSGGLVLLMAAILMLGLIKRHTNLKGGFVQEIFTGGLCGVLTVSLAMPGPAIATYIRSIGTHNKESARATILAYALIAYSAALIIHYSYSDFKQSILSFGLELIPATLGGVIFGSVLAHHFNEKTFQAIVILTLIATSLMLFASAYQLI